MDTAKIKVGRAKALEIMDFYKAAEIKDPGHPYDFFQASTPEGVIVKGYRTKSPDAFTVIFMGGGDKAGLEASVFVKSAASIVSSEPTGYDDIGEQIGSDEVGVGDFFGPMVVTAVYFLPSEMGIIAAMGVKDSKKLTDAHMLAIGKGLGAKLKHYTVMCTADKVDSYVAKGFSTHWILAKLHDFAQRRLVAKYGISEDVTVYIDQFEREPLYRKYAGPDIIKNPIIFRTKGESHYPSVAAASVISRYEFLRYWAKMERDLGMVIPKGAGSDVDLAYKRAIATNGKTKASKYVKRFFRNFKKQS